MVRCQGKVALGQVANGGCRVLPAGALRAAMHDKPQGYSPSFSEANGWRLEDFVSKLLLKCKQGNLFESLDQENIFSLFNRRSGPIAAAVAVTVEQFSG